MSSRLELLKAIRECEERVSYIDENFLGSGSFDSFEIGVTGRFGFRRGVMRVSGVPGSPVLTNRLARGCAKQMKQAYEEHIAYLKGLMKPKSSS